MASLRRSGVRLSSLGKSNGDLKMVISQLKTTRENYVAYTRAQEKALDDMTKWAFKEDNRAIQDAIERFNDVYALWFEAQRYNLALSYYDVKYFVTFCKHSQHSVFFERTSKIFKSLLL